MAAIRDIDEPYAPSPHKAQRLDRFKLQPFDRALAPTVAGWVRGDGELRLVAPYTDPPLTPEKILGWQRERQTGFVFEDTAGRPVAYGELVRPVTAPTDVWIGHVVVDPQRRGQGIGSAFTRAMCDRAFSGFGAAHVHLSVFEDNPIAEACYRGCGFRGYGRRASGLPDSPVAARLTDMRLARFAWNAAQWKARFAEATEGADWAAWYERFKAMRRESDPKLDEKIETLLRHAGAADGESFWALDLGAGPGNFAEAILRRYPWARVIAIEADPLMSLMGERALGPEFGERIFFDAADLRQEEWTLERASLFRFAGSLLALHWMSRRSYNLFARRLAKTIAPGGIFANADHSARERRTLRDWLLARTRPFTRRPPQPKSRWAEFWDTATAALGVEQLYMQWKAQTKLHEGNESGLTFPTQEAALENAGFQDAKEVWRHRADSIVVATR